MTTFTLSVSLCSMAKGLNGSKSRVTEVTCIVVPIRRGKAEQMLHIELATEDKLCNHSAYENEIDRRHCLL